MRILLIDDDEDLRNLLSRYIRAQWPQAEIEAYDPLERDMPGASFPLGDYDVVVLDYMLGRGDGLEWLKTLKQRARLPEGPVPHRRRQRDHRRARDESRRRRLPAQAGADAREADRLDPRAHREHGRAHGFARPRRAHGRPCARRQGAHPRHQGAAHDRRRRHGARLPRLARRRRRAAGGQDPAPGDRAQPQGAGALHGGIRPGRAHPEPPRGAHLRPRQLRSPRLPGDGILRRRRPEQAPRRAGGAAERSAEASFAS